MSSLFCSKDFWIDCSVHFNLEALPSLWYGVKRGAIPGAPCCTYAAAAVTLFFGSRPLASHIHSPAGACWGERLPHPFGPWCLIYTVSRRLGPPRRQTSMAKIRVGWLLKRFGELCFANLLRDVVFLSCFLSVCVQRAKGGSSRDGGYWCWLQIHFRLISTFFFGPRPLTVTGVPWSWHCSSKAAREQGE